MYYRFYVYIFYDFMKCDLINLQYREKKKLIDRKTWTASLKKKYCISGIQRTLWFYFPPHVLQ